MLLSSSNNFCNSIKNKIPRTNRNKYNNNQFFCNKLNTINNDKSFGILKPNISKSRANNVTKKNISKINTMDRTFIRKDMLFF